MSTRATGAIEQQCKRKKKIPKKTIPDGPGRESHLMDIRCDNSREREREAVSTRTRDNKRKQSDIVRQGWVTQDSCLKSIQQPLINLAFLLSTSTSFS